MSNKKIQPDGIIRLAQNPKDPYSNMNSYRSVMIKSNGFTKEDLSELDKLGLNYKPTVDPRAVLSDNVPANGIPMAEKYLQDRCPDTDKKLNMDGKSFYIRFIPKFLVLAILGIIIYMIS